MEPETILQASKYIAIGIAAWPICKYAFKPMMEGLFSDKERFDVINNVITTYKERYSKTVEERGKVAAELGKAGRNGKEISDILDQTLPFPNSPKMK